VVTSWDKRDPALKLDRLALSLELSFGSVDGLRLWNQGRNRKGVNRCARSLPQVSTLDEPGRGQSWGSVFPATSRLRSTVTTKTSTVEEGVDQKTVKKAVTNTAAHHQS